MMVPKKLNIESLCDPAILSISMHPKELKAGSQRDICIPMVIEELFTIAKMWKQLKCPSGNEWVNKVCYIYMQ